MRVFDTSRSGRFRSEGKQGKTRVVRESTDGSYVALLRDLGQVLDVVCIYPNGERTCVRDALMREWLKVRDKSGRLVPFVPNEAQQKIGEDWGNKNIILKARQLGMTTYVAARFFIETITRPGTLTVQVAHDQRSAEDIFRMVHRFQENLPEEWKQGVLKTSRANVRQLVWPCLDSEYRVESAADPNAGRGATIRNLHCSEVARWSRDGAEALRSLRAAVPPDGQVVMESTPQGAGGPFYEEWQKAHETGYVRHFLPWWMEKAYRVPNVGAGELSGEERELMAKHGLDEEQIVFRRGLRAELRGMVQQEYAENAEECFLASGECVFDAKTIEKRLKELGDAAASGGKVSDGVTRFLPAQARRYVIGVDPAGGGVEGDFACAQVIERTSGMQCAELHGHFTPYDLAAKVSALVDAFDKEGQRFMPRARWQRNITTPWLWWSEIITVGKRCRTWRRSVARTFTARGKDNGGG